MLVKRDNSNEHEIVMAIFIDIQDHRMRFVYSAYGNYAAQYYQDIDGHEIIDSTIPEYWIMGYDENEKAYIFSFPEWVNRPGKKKKPGFHEKYIDGSKEEVSIMKKYFEIEKEKYKNDKYLAQDMYTVEFVDEKEFSS